VADEQLDLREQITRIDRAIAATAKVIAEQRKLETQSVAVRAPTVGRSSSRR
jgi:hypothetical protein